MLKYNRINWTDGMLVNKSHFIGMENFLLETHRFSNKLIINKNTFGVIRPDNTGGDFMPVLKISIDSSDTNNQKIIIEDLKILGFTPDGALLHAGKENFSADKIILPVDFDLIKHGEPFYIVLLYSPYKRIGFGSPEDDIQPLYKPFCVPATALKCIGSKTANENFIGHNHFPVAKIKIINGMLIFDEEYIPPSVSINANENLMKNFLDIKSLLRNLEDSISGFIRASQTIQDRNVIYLKEIFMLVLSDLIGVNVYFDSFGETISPFFLVTTIKSLATRFRSLLLCNAEANTFFVEEWNLKYNLDLNELGRLIGSMNNYKHYEIALELKKCKLILKKYLLKIAEIRNYSIQQSKSQIWRPAKEKSDDFLTDDDFLANRI